MRPRFDNLGISGWGALLWGMALLSLLLIPADFRAGSEIAHGHSLMQLWVDAVDGRVDHHHHAAASPARTTFTDWLDPAVAMANVDPGPGDDRPDVADHHDSTPASSGIHLLLATATFLPPLAAARAPRSAPERRLAGRSPRVPLPPPR